MAEKDLLNGDSGYLEYLSAKQLPFVGKRTQCMREGSEDIPFLCLNNPSRLKGIGGFKIELCWECNGVEFSFADSKEKKNEAVCPAIIEDFTVIKMLTVRDANK